MFRSSVIRRICWWPIAKPGQNLRGARFLPRWEQYFVWLPQQHLETNNHQSQISIQVINIIICHKYYLFVYICICVFYFCLFLYIYIYIKMYTSIICIYGNIWVCVCACKKRERERREPLIFPQSFGIGGGSAEVPKHQTASAVRDGCRYVTPRLRDLWKSVVSSVCML